MQFEAELETVIDLHVVVARVHHPEARHPNLIVNLLFGDRIRLVIVPADDLHGQEQPAVGGGDQGEGRAKVGGAGNLDAGAGREQACAGQAIDAGGHFTVQALADLLVAVSRRGAGQGGPVQDFFVGLAHGCLGGVRRALLQVSNPSVPGAELVLQQGIAFPLEVLAYALSGQGGRLFTEIREKRALAYRVSAFSMEGIDPGYFAVYLASSPDNLEEAVKVVRQELHAAAEKGISVDELARAQRYLIGVHAIGLQRKSAIAAALAFHEAYGQGWKSYRQYGDNIMKVRIEDVARVARKYLDPQREVTAVVKPPAESPGVARAAARAGRVAIPARASDSATTGRAQVMTKVDVDWK